MKSERLISLKISYPYPVKLKEFANVNSSNEAPNVRVCFDKATVRLSVSWMAFWLSLLLMEKGSSPAIIYGTLFLVILMTGKGVENGFRKSWKMVLITRRLLETVLLKLVFNSNPKLFSWLFIL